MTDFDAPFQELIVEAAWGRVWSRPIWTSRERSIVTIALLAALGHDDEVAMHVRATANTGATKEDITEALLHVAIYAGVPAANRAIKIAKRVLKNWSKTDDRGRDVRPGLVEPPAFTLSRLQIDTPACAYKAAGAAESVAE